MQLNLKNFYSVAQTHTGQILTIQDVFIRKRGQTSPSTTWEAGTTRYKASSQIQWKYSDVGMFCLLRNRCLTEDELHTDQREAPLHSSEAKPLLTGNHVEKDSFSSGTMAPKPAATLFQVRLKSKEEQRVLTCMPLHSQSQDVSPGRTSLGIFEKAKGESYCNITILSLGCAEGDCLHNLYFHRFPETCQRKWKLVDTFRCLLLIL